MTDKIKFRKQAQPELPRPECQRVTPDPDVGLTQDQVDERIAGGYANIVTDDSGLTTGKIIRSNIFTYFNMIFFILALVLLYEGSINNLTFLGVVFVNAIIGIIQELRSKRELDK